jgi:hypothetical protein
MWIFTTLGFFSTVAHPEHADAVIVRARVRADIEALRAHVLPDLEITETRHRDYRFRATVSRDEWAHAVEQLALEIDYPNFKVAVAARQGTDRAHAYGRVWSVMWELQHAK